MGWCWKARDVMTLAFYLSLCQMAASSLVSDPWNSFIIFCRLPYKLPRLQYRYCSWELLRYASRVVAGDAAKLLSFSLLLLPMLMLLLVEMRRWGHHFHGPRRSEEDILRQNCNRENKEDNNALPGDIKDTTRSKSRTYISGFKEKKLGEIWSAKKEWRN